MKDEFCKRRQGNQMNLESGTPASARTPVALVSPKSYFSISMAASAAMKIRSNPADVIRKLLTMKDGKPIAKIPNESISSNGIVESAWQYSWQNLQNHAPVSFGQYYLASVGQNVEKHGIVQTSIRPRIPVLVSKTSSRLFPFGAPLETLPTLSLSLSSFFTAS